VNSKTIAAWLFFFALGLGIGTYAHSPQSGSESPLNPDLRQKLQNLANVDLEDYYRLKNSEEKFLKADEILGKIMTIFLADLGLHMSQGAVSASHEKFVPAPTSKSPDPLPARPNVPVPMAKAETPKPNALQLNQKAEAKLAAVRDDRDVPSLLRQTQIENLDEALRSTKIFANRTETASSLNGSFGGRGNLHYENQDHLWDVSITVKASMSASELNGWYKLELSENGHSFSTSNGSGRVPFKEFERGSQAVFMEAGDKIQIQFYYLKELDQVACNIYRRSTQDLPYALIGTAVLKRI